MTLGVSFEREKKAQIMQLQTNISTTKLSFDLKQELTLKWGVNIDFISELNKSKFS